MIVTKKELDQIHLKVRKSQKKYITWILPKNDRKRNKFEIRSILGSKSSSNHHVISQKSFSVENIWGNTNFKK